LDNSGGDSFIIMGEGKKNGKDEKINTTTKRHKTGV